jgi:3alpha(or 20beta)-hydroxysteroid dehydrogenase
MTASARVALVTGAARGHGAAIVRRMVSVGFRVAACDLPSDELHASAANLGEGSVITLGLDVTSADQWSTAVRNTTNRFGAIAGHSE